MIHQAAGLQDQVRAHDKLFLDPYAKPQSPTLTECASVWLESVRLRHTVPGRTDASEGRRDWHPGNQVVNSATVDGWFDPISLEIDTVFMDAFPDSYDRAGSTL